jgi:hypothetical protein
MEPKQEDAAAGGSGRYQNTVYKWQMINYMWIATNSLEGIQSLTFTIVAMKHTTTKNTVENSVYLASANNA